jgi:hypothetical protein
MITIIVASFGISMGFAVVAGILDDLLKEVE